MQKLTRQDLYSLEKYAEVRPQFRAQVMAHKENRRVAIGEHVTLYFEDRLTTQYQIQEMLRAERIFEAAGIEQELAAYNPLIPDGHNWKATLMIEYSEIEERRIALVNLKGIEKRVWMQVGDYARIYPITDEDLERETEEKTSAVHFLRFELSTDSVVAVKAGRAITLGIDHPHYSYQVDKLPDAISAALKMDID